MQTRLILAAVVLSQAAGACGFVAKEAKKEAVKRQLVTVDHEGHLDYQPGETTVTLVRADPAAYDLVVDLSDGRSGTPKKVRLHVTGQKPAPKTSYVVTKAADEAPTPDPVRVRAALMTGDTDELDFTGSVRFDDVPDGSGAEAVVAFDLSAPTGAVLQGRAFGKAG